MFFILFFTFIRGEGGQKFPFEEQHNDNKERTRKSCESNETEIDKQMDKEREREREREREDKRGERWKGGVKEVEGNNNN